MSKRTVTCPVCGKIVNTTSPSQKSCGEVRCINLVKKQGHKKAIDVATAKRNMLK